jgi:mannose-1-phosphate guanylyltransferase
MAVVPVNLNWGEIGSWPALAELVPPDDPGNASLLLQIHHRCKHWARSSTVNMKFLSDATNPRIFPPVLHTGLPTSA